MMPSLSEVTDLMMVDAGCFTLFGLVMDGTTVFGGPGGVAMCFEKLGDSHDYSIRRTENNTIEDVQYEVCSRCHHVRVAEYLDVGGVLVSRRPQPEPAEPMPIAWPAPVLLQLEHRS